MKKGFVAAAVLLIVLFLALALYFTVAPTERKAPDYSEAVQIPAPSPRPSPTPVPDPESTPVPTPEPTPYVSPVDFEALWERNPEIYAWLDIPNTNISYPVVQSEDDSYYLNHNSDGDYSGYGALYSESAYNGADFSDGITVLYGHRMGDGSMFGNLQRYYSEEDALEKYGLIRIYLPDRLIEYTAFAALPFDNRHILYQFGDDARGKRIFLYDIATAKGLDVQIDEAAFADPEDSLLVLSTCLRGNRSNRFLLVSKTLK